MVLKPREARGSFLEESKKLGRGTRQTKAFNNASYTDGLTDTQRGPNCQEKIKDTTTIELAKNENNFTYKNIILLGKYYF